MKKDAKFINTEKIEGYVYSTGSSFNELQERVTGENSKNPGTKYIAGDLDIAVDEAGLNVVTVHYRYVAPTTNKGSASPTYSALKQIIDNPERRWINGGKENAFKVLCTGVSIAVNDFIAGDGTKVAALRNENGFCSIVNELGPEDERNTFSTDMLVTKVTRIEANPDKNIKEDYATVSGAIFGYGASLPTLIPATFSIRNEMGIKYFEDLDASASNPVFTKLWGKINCMTIRVERTEESAFGEAAVQTYERKSREYLITGTAKVPYDFGDEEVLTVDDIKKMNQDRQVLLAEVEKRFNDKQNKTNFAAPTTSNNPVSNTKIPEGTFNF